LIGTINDSISPNLSNQLEGRASCVKKMLNAALPVTRLGMWLFGKKKHSVNIYTPINPYIPLW
jgi:hypothetical protein